MNRSLPPLRAARVFEAAARHCSFSKAARELNLSQAAISQQVKALESWFGFPLFQRNQNSLVLTDEGSALLPALHIAFDTISEIASELRNEKGARRVTLGVYPNLAMNWLVPRLHGLRQVLPGVEIEIITSTEPLAELFNRCDLAIRPFEHAPQFSFDFLFSAEMFPVAAPELLGSRLSLTPHEFTTYPLLHLSHSAEDWPLWFESAGIVNPESTAGLWFDSQAVMIEAACRGLGIGLARSPFDDEVIESERLRVLSTHRVACNHTWYVIVPAALRRGRISTAKDWLLSQCSGQAQQPRTDQTNATPIVMPLYT